jgi:hypothetical protein
MTVEQRLINVEKSNDRIEKALNRLLRTAKKESGDSDYIDAAEVKKTFGHGKETLRRMRREGIITKFKCSTSGPKKQARNFKYSKRELESLTIES